MQKSWNRQVGRALCPGGWGILIFTPLDIRKMYGRFRNMARFYLTGLALLVGFSIRTVYAEGAGKALDFDGVDDYVSVTDHASLDMTGALTIEVWVNISSLPSDIESIVTKWNKTGSQQSYALVISDKISFRISFDGSSIHTLEQSAQFPTGLSHVVGTNDGSYMHLFVNGTMIGDSTAFNQGIFNSSTNLEIGNAVNLDDKDTYFSGIIDEVRIWDVALTRAQFREMMCKKLTETIVGATNETGISGVKWSDLKGYWRFDEGTGTTAYDETANDNDGTLTNMASDDWVTSVAAIGDVSAYQYSATPSVTLTNSPESFKVDNFSADPTFAHVYKVESAPNYTTANSPLDHVSQNRYWGVFVGSNSPTYDVTNIYTDHGGIDNENVLELGTRTDPAVTSWSDAGATLTEGIDQLKVTGVSGNDEYILASTTTDNSLPVELTSLTARVDRSGSVVLEWVTESEVENLGFIVERRHTPPFGHPSQEGTETGDWQEIASYITHPELQGQGSATYRKEYRFIDETVELGNTYDYRLADVSYSGEVVYHSMIALGITVEPFPEKFELYQNYPNPFNPTTTFTYDLVEDGNVSLIICDLSGRQVIELVSSFQSTGSYEVTWDARGVSAGVYFCRLTSGENTVTRKLIYLK